MLKQTIQSEMIVALKAHDKIRLNVLRFLLSGIKYAEIEKQKELSEEEVVGLFQKEIKKRNEAIELFKKAGRTAQVTEEEDQVKIIQSFLPKQLSAEELGHIVDEAVARLGNSAQIGQVIGYVMGTVKGKADGSMVSALVRQKLAKK